MLPLPFHIVLNLNLFLPVDFLPKSAILALRFASAVALVEALPPVWRYCKLCLVVADCKAIAVGASLMLSYIL